MNKLEIQGSGFPATNETWRFIRDMINEVHQLTAFGGDNFILKGCVIDNTEVSDGYIVYNGELLPFKGGTFDTEVTIIETVTQTTYLEDLDNNGVADDKDTYFERYATFGDIGVVTFQWDALTRLNPLLEIQRRLPPKKCALPYWGDGSDLENGWQFCDGTNGTPDLRGQFIVGQDPANTDYENFGDQGGAEDVALTVAQMPVHNHDGNLIIPAHDHDYRDRYFVENFGGGADGSESTGGTLYGSGDTDGDNVFYHYKNAKTSQANASNANYTTNNKGGSAAHENRPPYYTMAYITDVGV